MALIGGDVTSTPGPLTLSITAFGEPLGARTPSRADARPGEDVWLAGGEIGSAWLGLALRTGKIEFQAVAAGRDAATAAAARDCHAPDYLRLPGQALDAEAAWLVSLSLAPLVQGECAAIVARFARASMDVSDGLVADAAKLAEASGVRLVIEAGRVPVAIPAERWVENGGDLLALLTGGDDYVALFTAVPDQRPELEAQAVRTPDLRLTRIGWTEAGAGVAVLDCDGRTLDVARAGFRHRLGR